MAVPRRSCTDESYPRIAATNNLQKYERLWLSYGSGLEAPSSMVQRNVTPSQNTLRKHPKNTTTGEVRTTTCPTKSLVSFDVPDSVKHLLVLETMAEDVLDALPKDGRKVYNCTSDSTVPFLRQFRTCTLRIGTPQAAIRVSKMIFSRIL